MSAKVEAIRKDEPATGVRLHPLVLDLDGSLMRCDILHETALAFLRRNPLGIFALIGWLLQGRAVVKRRLAERVGVEVDALPVNEELAAYAAREKAKGREVVLATATDVFLATAVARRFPFIDRVIASDGIVNLKGAAKADKLERAYPDGFVYAGDSSVDLPVWKRSSGAVLVETSRRTARAAARMVPVETAFARTGRLRTVLKAARLHQWAKNALVFVPMVLGGAVADLAAWAACGLAFAALSILASTTYLFNDLWDLPDDRKHWSKKHRPLASGRLSVPMAVGALPVGLAVAFALAAMVNAGVVAVLAVYLAITVAYSTSLKRQPILDAFVLAVLFTLRLGLGMAAVAVDPSPWLLVFSMFLFTSLSFAKRHVEIERMAARGLSAVAGRGYLAGDGGLILALGAASGIGAVLIMVLYLIDDAFRETFYGNPIWLWAFPPVLFLWIGRVWLKCQRGELNDDPVAFAVRDAPSVSLGVVMGVAFLFAFVGL